MSPTHKTSIFLTSCLYDVNVLADRAKSIKTKAVINESATDKLIRELREENARLLQLLKQGGGAAGSAPPPIQHQGSSAEIDQGKPYGSDRSSQPV